MLFLETLFQKEKEEDKGMCRDVLKMQERMKDLWKASDFMNLLK